MSKQEKLTHSEYVDNILQLLKPVKQDRTSCSRVLVECLVKLIFKKKKDNLYDFWGIMHILKREIQDKYRY